jgi:hypothetical protein
MRMILSATCITWLLLISKMLYSLCSCAKDGANIAIVSKTTEPHPKLPGTIFTVAKVLILLHTLRSSRASEILALQEVEDAGGRAIPLECDVRSEEQVVLFTCRL